ncbi:MAG: 30S ribosomal protein S18 [Patescibacteria group bacterium]
MSVNSKQCFFKQNQINHIDYKDIEILKRFINPHGRILSSKKTGVCAKNQRKLANAIKLARFMSLMPYVAR